MCHTLISIKKHIPNFFTCLNLICGSAGIISVFEWEIVYASYFIWIAAVFDFLDGFLARIFNAYSPIGKDLDSLADMVTFGVLPGFMMYKLLGESSPQPYLPYISFTIIVFSALRLAKFNIDTRQTHSFIGLPTPANALFISSLPVIILFNQNVITDFIQNPGILIAITLSFSLLLVSELPLFSLKFKNFNWTDNIIRYIFLTLAFIMVILFKFVSIPLIIILYILMSIFENTRKKHEA